MQNLADKKARAWRRYNRNKQIDTTQLTTDQCRILLRLQDRLYLFAVSDQDAAFWKSR